MSMYNFSWNELSIPTDDKLITRRIYELSPYDIFIAKNKDRKKLKN